MVMKRTRINFEVYEAVRSKMKCPVDLLTLLRRLLKLLEDNCNYHITSGCTHLKKDHYNQYN